MAETIPSWSQCNPAKEFELNQSTALNLNSITSKFCYHIDLLANFTGYMKSMADMKSQVDKYPCEFRELSIPVEGTSTTSSVQQATDGLVAAKTRLNTDIKVICTDIDNLFKMSNEFRRDTRKLEKGVDNLPVLEDWLREKVSTIDQLKSQIIFLHKVMDEEWYWCKTETNRAHSLLSLLGAT